MFPSEWDLCTVHQVLSSVRCLERGTSLAVVVGHASLQKGSRAFRAVLAWISYMLAP